MSEVMKKAQEYTAMSEVFTASAKSMEGLTQVHATCFESEEVLSTKTKELICVGIAVAVRCEACIYAHVGASIQAGVTREELIAALDCAVLMGGGPGSAYGMIALNVYDEMTAAAK